MQFWYDVKKFPEILSKQAKCFICNKKVIKQSSDNYLTVIMQSLSVSHWAVFGQLLDSNLYSQWVVIGQSLGSRHQLFVGKVRIF